MNVKNLEQERAAHALRKSKTIGKGAGAGESAGEAAGVVKKVAAQTISCGLLASMAFALEKKCGYADTYQAFIDYCPDLKSSDIREALEELSNMDSSQLRHITTEFMKYLAYLRRFV